MLLVVNRKAAEAGICPRRLRMPVPTSGRVYDLSFEPVSVDDKEDAKYLLGLTRLDKLGNAIPCVVPYEPEAEERPLTSSDMKALLLTIEEMRKENQEMKQMIAALREELESVGQRPSSQRSQRASDTSQSSKKSE